MAKRAALPFALVKNLVPADAACPRRLPLVNALRRRDAELKARVAVRARRVPVAQVALTALPTRVRAAPRCGVNGRL